MLNTWPSRWGASPRRIEKEEEALSGSEYLAEGRISKYHKLINVIVDTKQLLFCAGHT